MGKFHFEAKLPFQWHKTSIMLKEMDSYINSFISKKQKKIKKKKREALVIFIVNIIFLQKLEVCDAPKLDVPYALI